MPKQTENIGTEYRIYRPTTYHTAGGRIGPELEGEDTSFRAFHRVLKGALAGQELRLAHHSQPSAHNLRVETDMPQLVLIDRPTLRFGMPVTQLFTRYSIIGEIWHARGCNH
jgi:hypothetical protein